MKLDDILECTQQGEQSPDKWRITALTEHFVIATRANVEGEPTRWQDIIKVDREWT